MTLNSSQLKAVELDAPLIVVPSGPGSGKTRVGVLRGRRLVRAKRKVVVLTYTNSAANEYRKRISDCNVTGIHSACESLHVDFCGTLHSYCFKVVRQFGYKIGYALGNVGILPESDQLDLLREVRQRLGFETLSMDFIAQHRDEPRAAQIWAEYRFLLKRNNLVDYDRILVDAFLLLADSEVRHEMRCDDLIVDEAQDSAEIDWSIYKAIPASCLFIIGDVDQAIFEFRGAYPRGFLECAMWERNSRPAEVIKLEQNYRCGNAICFSANKLIKHNKSRFEKDTIAATNTPSEVTVTVRDDPWSELNWMAARLAEYQMNVAQNVAYRSCAVLCRTNHEVQRAFDYLRSNTSIAVHAGYEFQRTPPDWHRALLLIGLEASPYNEILAERFLRLDHDGALVDRWKIEGQARGEYLTDRIKHAPPTNNMHELLEYLALHGVGQETIYAIKARMALMAEDSSILDLLQDLNAHQTTDKTTPEGAVYVGTIHSAKGREFDVVFLPAFEEMRAYEMNLEEERRLAFVALTRARRAVHISWSKQRKPKWGEITECKPSRFIAEMNL
jgi:DNA helicase-2/ATP-dependent DNA helicase PcrA